MITIPGRHGQRPLNAALLGGGAAALCFFGLRGVLHHWIPGIAAIVAGVLGMLFGLVAVGWATAALVALLFAAGGALAAHETHLWIAPVAVAFGGVGLFLGMVNHQRLSVVLPPLFAAAFVALGCAISWAPGRRPAPSGLRLDPTSHWRGAKLWQLNDVDWVLGLFGAVAVVLLVVAFERKYRQKLRLAARTRRMEDEELKKKLEAQRAAHERYLRVNGPH